MTALGTYHYRGCFWIAPKTIFSKHGPLEVDLLPDWLADRVRVRLLAQDINLTDEVFTKLKMIVPRTPKELAEHSFIYFVHHYLGNHTYNAFADAHYKLGQYLSSFGKAGEELKRLLWIFPREHAKTTLVTFAFVLWCILYRRKRNIVLVSDVQNQAKEFLRNIKVELENNEAILRDFGEMKVNKKLLKEAGVAGENFKGKWGEQHIITSNNVQVKVLSPTSQIRGLIFNAIDYEWDEESQTNKAVLRTIRPDLIILDDVNDDKLVRNLAIRDWLEDWFFQALFNALDSDKGEIAVLGTILHKDDLLSRLWNDTAKTAGWIKERTPACEMDATGEPKNILWPARWTREKLIQRRRSIGSVPFTIEFLLQPIDDLSLYFDRKNFVYYEHESLLGSGLSTMQQVMKLADDLIVSIAIDPAYREKEQNDPTAIACLGFSPATRYYYLLDLWAGKVNPQGRVNRAVTMLLKWARGFGGKYHFKDFVFESNAAQEGDRFWMGQELKMRGLGHVKIVERTHTRDKKRLRIGSLSPLVEQKRLLLPWGAHVDLVTGTKYGAPYYPDLEAEMDNYPQVPHDDQCDALQMAYSSLISIEKRYVAAGTYGLDAIRDFEGMTKYHKVLQGDIY